MPEGDTIYRTATALRAALLGKPLVSFAVPRHVGLMPSSHAVVERVESHGKHLEIGFDDAVVLHTHMRMTGSWHLYRIGEHWRKPEAQARVVLEVPGWKAVCFNAPVVELYRAREASRHPGLGSLGPDLVREDADFTECVARIDRYCSPAATVAEMLLDQRIACGVGNVFKSEVLWAAELHPFTVVEALSVDQRFRLIELSSSMLRANLEHAGRVTVPGVAGGLAVYGRTGKPCLRCGHPVEVRRHGQQARVTYFCAECQLLLGAMPVAPADGDADDGRDTEPADPTRRPGAVAEGDGRPEQPTDGPVAPRRLRPGRPPDRRDASPTVRRGPDGPDLALGEDRHPAARLWRERSDAAARRAEPVAPPRRVDGRGQLRVVDPLLARRAAGR